MRKFYIKANIEIESRMKRNKIAEQICAYLKYHTACEDVGCLIKDEELHIDAVLESDEEPRALMQAKHDFEHALVNLTSCDKWTIKKWTIVKLDR